MAKLTPRFLLSLSVAEKELLVKILNRGWNDYINMSDATESEQEAYETLCEALDV